MPRITYDYIQSSGNVVYVVIYPYGIDDFKYCKVKYIYLTQNQKSEMVYDVKGKLHRPRVKWIGVSFASFNFFSLDLNTK